MSSRNSDPFSEDSAPIIEGPVAFPEVLRSSPEEPKANQKRINWSFWAKAVLFILGGVALYLLITKLGVQQVWAAIRRAGVWLPLIFVLDIAWLSIEGLGLRLIYGEARHKIPLPRWIYAGLMQYVTFMLAPMGRVSGELARAAYLGRHVGKDRAAVGAALMQSLTMVGNAVISFIAVSFVFFLAPKSALVWTIWGNLLMLAGIGITSYLVMRHVKLGGFLGRRFSKLAAAGPGFDAQFRASAGAHFPALLICLLSRCVQVMQYGVIILAVTGEVRFSQAWMAEGIQLVARSAGDMIPNQVGVSEGMFTLFRAPLGLQASATLALSIALVARVSNLTMAASCALAMQLWPRSWQELGHAATEAEQG